MKVLLLITSFNRPEALRRLLLRLGEEAGGAGLELRALVFDDCSPKPLMEAPAFATIHYKRRRHGKKRYWSLISSLFAAAKAETSRFEPDYYVMLPDDAVPVEDFFVRALAKWEAIADVRKIALNPMRCREHTTRPQWTPLGARLEEHGGFVLLKTGWNDLAFVTDRRFFDALSWKIHPIHEDRWRRQPLLGSGVGAQISTRLFRQGYTFYQVTESLIGHGQLPSEMNPHARILNPLTA